MTEKIIANAQTKSHILGSKQTKDNQGEPAGTDGMVTSWPIFLKVKSFSFPT
jgi:hypothetical protein